MKKYSITLSLLLLLWSIFELAAQSKYLQSGPMVAYSTMREVLLWVQTTEACDVQFKYYPEGAPQQKQNSAKHRSTAENAFVLHIPVKVEPGKRYTYELWINGKQVKLPYKLAFQSQTLWQWRSDPPNFKFAFGSCTYINEDPYDRPGKPYGGDYEIFTSILQKSPDFMLWGGDNIYLREVDWNTRSGILHRHTHTRSLPELQPLLASVHHYGTWDDHDFGPNNADRGFWNKDLTRDAFKLFFPNYNYVGEGITSTFFWQDVQFFMLDDRYFRSPNNLKTDKPSILGEAQLDWLIDALKFSRASFKFIVLGVQALNPADQTWGENFVKVPKERQKLLDAIRDNDIRGVIFLTGDRHHSELSMLNLEGAYPIYDLTSSPLTSSAVGERAREEANTYRVEGTYYGERNFAMLEVSGERTDRLLTIKLFSTEGKQIWEKAIKARDLRAPRKAE